MNKEALIKDLFSNNPKFNEQHVKKLMDLWANNFKYIMTTCRKKIIFDDEDYDLLRSYTLFIDGRNQIIACLYQNEKKTVLPASKLVLKLEGHSVIKFKNGNKLDLRKENLEVISHQIAHFKQRKSKNNTSGYKGVSLTKSTNRYSAYIKIDNKKKHLGYYSNLEDAAKAYNDAAIKYFGKEYANLNILDYSKNP